MLVLLSGTMGESPKPGASRRLARAGAALVVGFATAACGMVDDGHQGTPTPSEGNSGSDGMGTSNGPGEMPAPVLECTAGRLPRRAVWLSDLQFARAITQLLGPAALDAEQVPDAALEPISQNGVVISRSLLQKRLDLAGRASASLQGRVAEVTGCAASDDACARAFIAALAAKAFRRPVLEAELTDLNAVYDAGRETDLEMGVRLAVEAVIASSSDRSEEPILSLDVVHNNFATVPVPQGLFGPKADEWVPSPDGNGGINVTKAEPQKI